MDGLKPWPIHLLGKSSRTAKLKKIIIIKNALHYIERYRVLKEYIYLIKCI